MRRAMADHADKQLPRPVTSVGVVRRMVCALSLIPIAVFSAFLGMQWYPGSTFAGVPIDDTRVLNFVFAAVTVFASIFIWRSVIIWTLGRRVLTAAVGVVPFIQVAVGRPMWDAGCVSNDILRASQEQISIGIWVWLMIWVWWGWERFGSRNQAAEPLNRRTRMNRNIKLVVASIGTIPFAVGCFFIITELLDDVFGISMPPGIPLSYSLAAMVAVSSWLIIWRRRVEWSAGVKRRTYIATAVLLVVPIAGTLLADRFGGPVDTTLYLLPLLGWGLWMATTMWLWRLRATGFDTSEDGPVCLQCGYMLKGLKKTRCPECGAEPTLDELWAATCAEM